MIPVAGTGKGFGSWKTTSGLGILQPSTNCFGAGISLGSPRGAPASAQAARVLISLSDIEASFENVPKCGSANHGGIFFCSTAALIAFAHGRVCSYVSNENGAAWPGRWQVWQFCCRIGATSLVKVNCAGNAALTPITRTNNLRFISSPIVE